MVLGGVELSDNSRIRQTRGSRRSRTADYFRRTVVNCHILTPFSRPENLPALIRNLEPQGIQWHLIAHDYTSVEKTLDGIGWPTWVDLIKGELPDDWDPCYWKLNHWIEDQTIVDDDYYAFLCDDDGYEPGFWDAIRQTHQTECDVIFVSMKRGVCVPPGSRWGTETRWGR